MLPLSPLGGEGWGEGGLKINVKKLGNLASSHTCLEHYERRSQMSDNFEPVILGFLCNWCAYAGADLAGVSRLQYPPNLRVVRVNCSGMVHPDLVVYALNKGVDGVMVMG